MNIRIDIQSRKIKYRSDSCELLQRIAEHKKHCLLLESAQVDSKENLKSLLLIDASVRIECRGSRVRVEAISENSRTIIKYLKFQLSNYLLEDECSDELLVFEFPKPEYGLNEDQRLKSVNSFEVIRKLRHLGKYSSHEFMPFLAGIFGYDLIALTEDIVDVPDGANTCPDYVFYLAESLLISDHKKETSEIAVCQFGSANKSFEKIFSSTNIILNSELKEEFPCSENFHGEVVEDISDEDFGSTVVSLKENIKKGDVFQVVPSRTFSLPCNDALKAYRQLKKQNPSPYMFYVKDTDFVLFGASPESAVKYTAQSNEVEVYPIAGTRKRGFNSDGSINSDLDSRIEQELRSDKKEIAEHMMLVDLARNDISRVSEPGSRFVCDLQKVDRYSFVMHLVSRVKGKLRFDLDPIHAYQACLNMGTLVGAPKIRAAELIREVEKKRRGTYGGAVGYFSSNGDMDTCIVIRSAFVSNGVAHIQAGAGVVFDSDPKSEADETRSKAQAVINAIVSSQEPERQDETLIEECVV